MMHIRVARYGNDVLRIAELMHERVNKRAEVEMSVCRSRAHACVMKGMRRRPPFALALVAVTVDDTVHGFMYAEEQQAFDLCDTVRYVAVPFLFGGKGLAVPLLRRLREMTTKRIILENLDLVNRPAAFERLLRPLAPQRVGTIYQV